MTTGLRPDPLARAVDGRCLRHVQDDRADTGVLSGKGLEITRPMVGRKHDVAGAGEAYDGGPADSTSGAGDHDESRSGLAATFDFVHRTPPGVDPGSAPLSVERPG